MKKIATALILTVVLAFCASAYAASQSFTARGLFVMGDDDTKAKAKDFALQDAKRLALEQAGTYLRSSTQVVNGQVAADEIISIASGVIKLEKIIKEETLLDNNVILLSVTAQFTIDSDDLKEKIDALKRSERGQEDVQKMADLQKRYDRLLAENNQLKTQMAQTGEQEAKEQLLRKTRETNNKLTATQWYERAAAYLNKGQNDLAINDFTKAIELDPGFADAYHDRGSAYLNKGQFDLALADLNKVIELAPQFALVYYNRSVVYSKTRQLDLALADLNKAVELDSQFFLAYYYRGLIYSLINQNDLAIADLNKAIELVPQFERAYYSRGLVYAKARRFDLAIVSFDKAIQLNPRFANAYTYRGLAYVEKGQFDLAIADYTVAIELDNLNGDVYYNRGISYCHKKQYSLALADMKKALALDPDNDVYLQWYKILLYENQQKR